MRIMRVVLALAFGLAMAGPEAHECPVHDTHAFPSAPASHHDASAPGHQDAALCTCPQACCPVGVGVSLPQPSDSWFVSPQLTRFPVVPTSHTLLLSPRKHFLPFALAPPHALA